MGREAGIGRRDSRGDGRFDAHLGGVGSGITSRGFWSRSSAPAPAIWWSLRAARQLADIPGICGIVDGSILPGYFGLEAGQSAVGDIFNWFVNYIQPGGKDAGSHTTLTEKAAETQARPIGSAGPGLEQRQSHDPGRPAAHGPALGPDASYPAGGDLPGADRGNRVRGSDHHQSV